MGECYEKRLHRYLYCASYPMVYLTIAVIVPSVISILILTVTLYFRCQRKKRKLEGEIQAASCSYEPSQIDRQVFDVININPEPMLIKHSPIDIKLS